MIKGFKKTVEINISAVNGINQFVFQANWFFFLKKSAKIPLGCYSHFQKGFILYYLFFTFLSYNLVYYNIFEWEGYACHQF